MIMGHPWRSIGVGALATAVVCAALMVWVDQPLAVTMAQFRDTRFVAVFELVTDLANSAIWYTLGAAGIVLAWRASRRDDAPSARALFQRRLRAGLFLISSMVISGLIVNALKLAIGRSRPKMFVYDHVADFTPFRRVLDACSFPSGHSQSIWAAMIALAWIFPRWRVTLFVVAVVVSSSRIIVGAHYASDVVAGAYVAFAVALVMRQWFEREGVRLSLAAV